MLSFLVRIIFFYELLAKEQNNMTTYVSKKRLTDYRNFLTAYRQICCEANVKVSRLNYENYMFY